MLLFTEFDWNFESPVFVILDDSVVFKEVESSVYPFHNAVLTARREAHDSHDAVQHKQQNEHEWIKVHLFLPIGFSVITRLRK